MRGVMVEEFERQSSVIAVINEREQAVGAIVEFIDSDVAEKVGESLVEVFVLNDGAGFSFPPPRPSSGWCRAVYTRGGLATCARQPGRRAGCPQ